MALKLEPHDSAEFFQTPEAQDELLADAIESGDAKYLAHALGVIARARGMSAVQKEAGVNRQALYKALSSDGNPSLETIMKVLKALNLRMTIAHAEPA